MNDIFAQMYPDATFVALVRDGLALLEGHLRRGWSVKLFAEIFVSVMCKIEADSQTYRDRYYVFRYEDMVTNPIAFLTRLYEAVGLDVGDLCGKVRLKVKRHFQEDGQWTADRVPGQKYWFTFEEMTEQLNPAVDRYQITRLQKQEI